MANDDVAKQVGTRCAATLGFFIAMPIGCAGGAATGFLIGNATPHNGDAIMAPVVWMTLLGALVGNCWISRRRRMTPDL